MQIIQKIRDKGAAIVIAVIALSLIGFILMDANLGSSRMSASGASSIGEINGATVDSKEFQDKVKQIEDQYGGRISGSQVYMLRQSAWDQMVAEKVLGAEFEKLGLLFSPKELSSIIFSNDAPQSLKQAFTDKTTGIYDIAKVQQWWQSAKKFKGEQREAIESQVVEPIKIQAQYTKYSGLIAASGYYPTWMKEKETADGKAFANISYVAVPYNVINDSTIKISDQEITDYIGKHKAQYTQDGGRQISYVAFNATPSAGDTAKTLESVASLKTAFIADTNAKVFVSRNVSAKDFDDAYTLKSKLTMAQKDSIVALPSGAVYGPYLDGKDFEIAKMVSTKILPDSIKCRHILIATTDRQTGQPTLSDSIAKNRIDSVELAIKGGANFDELESKYSSDQAAHQDKGVMTFDLATIQNKVSFAPEFGSFLLNENGETKKVIKTSFGWHYIEILEKKNPSSAYKIAYLAKEVVASEETINTASVNASKLSAEARNAKTLDAYIAKNGLQKIEGLINQQLASLKESQEFTRNGKSVEELNQHLQNGKGLMDSIRREIGVMQNKEEELLTERIEEINFIRYRDYLFVFIALFIGLLMRLIAFYLFDRGIVRRINRLTENVSAISEGKEFQHPLPKKDDAIGLLEQEIVKIGEKNNLDLQSKE